MKKILIVGYFGFENFGDEWLLKNLTELIKKTSLNKKKIYVLYNLKRHIKINDVHYIPRWNPFLVLETLIKINTIIYCGGLFQDYTSLWSFFYYLFIFLCSKLFLKKILLLNTEFSFKRIPSVFIYLLCAISDIVVFRNKIELNKIKKYFKSSNKILFSPDICYFESENIDVIDVFKKEYSKICLILKSEPKELEFLKKFCKELSRENRLVFFPLHLKQDYKFSLEIAKGIKNCEIRIWDKVENYKNILEDIDLIITSRLHGIIISDSLKIPFICISTQNKIKNLMLSIYNKDCVDIENINFEKLNDLIVDPLRCNFNFKNEINNMFKYLSNLNYF
ncbi:MAG: polysaccharide pyruvyl transferase family protein [Endomicrobiia bacterium]